MNRRLSIAAKTDNSDKVTIYHFFSSGERAKLERGFNRPRFLNYKTRVIFNIFSNINILSQILINSEMILKCHKLFEARHNTQNAKIAVGTMVIISTNFEK
jgi:hypothetical protein